MISRAFSWHFSFGEWAMPPLGTSLADPCLNSQGWLPRTLNSSCFSIQGKVSLVSPFLLCLYSRRDSSQRISHVSEPPCCLIYAERTGERDSRAVGWVWSPCRCAVGWDGWAGLLLPTHTQSWVCALHAQTHQIGTASAIPLVRGMLWDAGAAWRGWGGVRGAGTGLVLPSEVALLLYEQQHKGDTELQVDNRMLRLQENSHFQFCNGLFKSLLSTRSLSMWQV